MEGLTITEVMALMRKLVSIYVVDKETREEIAGKTDEEIFAIADEAVNNAERKNDAFINRLTNEGEDQ